MERKVAAEFLGTFVLVLGGCGAAVLAAGVNPGGIGLLGVSLAFGLTVVTMVYAWSHIWWSFQSCSQPWLVAAKHGRGDKCAQLLPKRQTACFRENRGQDRGFRAGN